MGSCSIPAASTSLLPFNAFLGDTKSPLDTNWTNSLQTIQAAPNGFQLHHAADCRSSAHRLPALSVGHSARLHQEPVF